MKCFGRFDLVRDCVIAKLILRNWMWLRSGKNTDSLLLLLSSAAKMFLTKYQNTLNKPRCVISFGRRQEGGKISRLYLTVLSLQNFLRNLAGSGTSNELLGTF